MATTTLTPAAAAYRSGLYEWLTTTDHKKIGILYIVNSFIFFFIGGLLALGVRTELAQPGIQFVPTRSVYNQLFTMHGTMMIFLFIIPMLAGFGNYVVPLQIGAPDMAFPRINALSFWMLPLGGILLLLGFVDRRRRRRPAGRATARSPRTARSGRPGSGEDLWIMALVLIGTSSILGAHQLPRDDLQDARARDDDVPDADPRLDGPRDERPRRSWRRRSSRAP